MATDPTVAAKVRIADSLKAFKSGALAINAVNFFESLGYSSDKTHELESNTAAGLLELANQRAFLNPAKAHAEEWKTVDFLFQLTDEEIRNFGRASLEFDSTVDVAVGGKHIESYIFFAVELEKDSYTRTDLADTTREINRLFPMPALVLFKHGESLTLSIINRRIHKRDIARDVLEKVTLIKDLNINNPHRGHIEILFDLALPQLIATHEVTNFVQLDDAWRKTLDTSVLNKRFYKELANWYFWALQNVEFPKQAGITDDVNRATNVIRLITRLIFVWFLKERELVPDALFDRASLDDLLKDLSPDKSTFYKAILQNLFFATLNTPMDDPNAPRVFRSETNGKRFNDQYMVHNQYRHQKLFKDPEHALEIFAGIPFLNGGLFECLDKPAEVDGKKVEIRIDGFSDVAKKQPTVPNKLFFGGEERIDLNETYGTRGKRYSVCGLIETLNRYKFTIAENTPIEEEVALDPELLGKVFENLLASYNPETGATARKQTGSFYTPREIVNYMVDESLIAYLETQLNSESKAQNVDNLNERLRQLFAYTDEPHQFSAGEVDTLIAAIDAVKILDPACGSGAFPMGILQRLVFILSKLDPNNAKWEQRQIERVREAMRAAEKIEDHKFRENTLNDLKSQIANINEAFKNNELDYGRKLFLIENCIYGVDIQPIAIQIAKLRFFISLIIDQRIRSEAENLGVRPLPNLETKFISANTLIDLEKPAQSLLRNTAIDDKERELKIVRQHYFTARTTRTKEKFRKEDERLRREIGALLESEGNFPHETTEKLVGWNPYDQNASAGFFDSEWMFGVRDGFNIVIGNPPYHQLSKDRTAPLFYREYLRTRYKTSGGRLNTFVFFTHRGLELAATHGELMYIVPNTLLTQEYYKETRSHLLQQSLIRQIVHYPEMQFENAVIENVTIQCSRPARLGPTRLMIQSAENVVQDREVILRDIAAAPDFSFNVSDDDILRKIDEANHILLDELCEINQAIALRGDKSLSLRQSNPNRRFYKLLDGRNINRYVVNWGGVYLDYNLNRIHSCKRKDIFESKEKLMFRRVSSRLIFTYDSDQYYALNTIVVVNRKEPDTNLKLYLGILNSVLMDYYYTRKFKSTKKVFSEIQARSVGKLPIPILPDDMQSSITNLVEEILGLKKANVDADTSKLEAQIDQLLFEFYHLSHDQISQVVATI